MALRGDYGTRRRALEAPASSDSVAAWMRRYLEAQRVRGLSAHEIDRQSTNLSRFLAWCEEREIRRPGEITKPMLERYQRYLFYVRRSNGAPLSATTQINYVHSVRAWFRWLVRHNYVLSNPAADLELPRAPRRILPAVLSADEAESILAQPDVATPVGIRDRAMLEVLYATGIRRAECVHLGVHDVDAGRGVLHIRQGKGRKDRIVPVGERALAWIAQYLDRVRPSLVADTNDTALFLSTKGGPLVLDALSALVRRYVDAAGLGKTGSCHLFRHTAATLMLDGGADLRYVRDLLGHSCIQTTQIYTHVSIEKLKAIHGATHPGARLQRKPDAVPQDLGDTAD